MATIIKDITLTKLSATLPNHLEFPCCSKHNDNIYIFGGYASGNGYSDKIYKFNCVTKTIELLNVTLPQTLQYSCCATCGDNIYIFGGYNGNSSVNTIYKFNCNTDTIETLSVTLPKGLYYACCYSYEDNIYIFGGYDGEYSKTIYKFNSTNETIETLSITLSYRIANACCSRYGDNIYIFGGYNYIDGNNYFSTIYKFNCKAETIVTLNKSLPKALRSAYCDICTFNIYIFGGKDNKGNRSTTIYEFNCETESFKTLDITLPYELSGTGFCCSNYVNDIYIFGGSYNYNVYDFSLIVETYNLKYDISSNDGSKQYVELLDNTPIKAITFNNVNGTNTVEYIFETLTSTLQGSFEIDEIQNKHLVGFSTIVNATSIQIPLNQRVEINISVDTNFYAVYTTYRPLANTFKLELYNNTSEDNRVDKTNYLTKVGELAGVLREESSLVEMSLTLELEELPLFNYVYIEQLNRYYYVTDIVSVKYKLWTISLSVDVLMSYKNALLSCSAFVDRNENSYDNTIIDKKRVIQQGYDIEVSTVTNELLDNTSTNNIVLTGFYVKSV